MTNWIMFLALVGTGFICGAYTQMVACSAVLGRMDGRYGRMNGKLWSCRDELRVCQLQPQGEE